MEKRSPWLIFLLVAVAQFMVVLDTSITNVAIPAIKQSLHFDTASLDWVITAYALTFGGFLLLGGRMADLFGRRKTLLIGMSGFTLFSLLIGLSQSAMQLIILRALQGLTGALMSPSALSIVLITFAEGRERNKALGLWTTVATGGAAVGLLLGGILTQYFGWRWNFFINVPIGIVVSFAISKFVPLHEKETLHNDLDLPGAVLITSSLMLFVYVISRVPSWGMFSVWTVSLTLVVIALLAIFIFNESRSNHPLIPLSIFRIRNVVGANLMMTPIYAGLLGMFFLTSLYIQTILHYSPVQTGLSFLPFPIILGVMSTRVASWVSKYGYKRFLIAGPLLVALSMAWLSRLPVNGNYFIDVLPTILLMPIGVGMTFMPIIAAATTGVEGNKAGLASGLINTSQQMGGALGLTILSGVAAAITTGTKNPRGLSEIVYGYDRAFMVGVAFVLMATFLGAIIIVQKRQPGSRQTSQVDLAT